MSNIDDTKTLRMNTVGNVWSGDLMRKYHPRESYTGELIDLPSPLMSLSILFSQNNSLQDLVEICGMPQYSIMFELLNWALRDTHNNLGKVEYLDTLKLSTSCLVAGMEVHNSVQKLKVEDEIARPATYVAGTKALFGDTFSSPCNRAAILASTVVYINANIDLTDEQLTQLQDAAYLLGMLCVMAGLNYVDDVTRAFELVGLWELETSGVSTLTEAGELQVH